MRWTLMVVLIAAAFVVPQSAGAEESFFATARLSQTAISVNDPSAATVNFHQKFSTISAVCFGFTFANDLIDAGDQLGITFLGHDWGGGGFGFSNPGPGTLAERTICTPSDPTYWALFVDGKEHKISIGMGAGTAEIESLVVTVVGTPLR